MRTAEELIRELDQEAGNFMLCGLVVGFEDELKNVCIRADDPDRRYTLEEAVKAGGRPMGIIGCNVRNGALYIVVRPLEQYADRDLMWGEYLERLANAFCRLAMKPGQP